MNSYLVSESVLHYASLISKWGCCREGHKQCLDVLQNRAARIVARTVRSNPAVDVLKWPTLEERGRKSVFKLVKKCLQGFLSPNILNNILKNIVNFVLVALNNQRKWSCEVIL